MHGLIKMLTAPKQSEVVVEKIEELINIEGRNNRFNDAGMFRDPGMYLDRASHLLNELVEGMAPDENDLVILKRLSLMFAEASQEAVKLNPCDEKKHKTNAGKLLVKRLGLAKTGGYEPQMEQSILNGDRYIHKIFNSRKGTPSEMKARMRDKKMIR